MGRLKKWNTWRKRCRNGKFHKLLVLLKLRRSPTFEHMLLNLEEEDSTLTKIKTHVKRWRYWVRWSGNSKFTNLMVLLGLRNPPSFRLLYVPDDTKISIKIKEK